MEYMIQARTLRASGLFDDSQYPMSMAARFRKQDPAVHYLQTGEGQGVKPSNFFDPLYYTKRYPDVAKSGISPALHFINWGRNAGLRQLPMAQDFNYPEVQVPKKSGNLLLLGAPAGHSQDDQAAKRLLKLTEDLAQDFTVVRLYLNPLRKAAPSKAAYLEIVPNADFTNTMDRIEFDLLFQKLVKAYAFKAAVIADEFWHGAAGALKGAGLAAVVSLPEKSLGALHSDSFRQIVDYASLLLAGNGQIRERCGALYPAVLNKQVLLRDTVFEGGSTLAAELARNLDGSSSAMKQDLADISLLDQSELFDPKTYMGPASVLPLEQASKLYVESYAPDSSKPSTERKRKPCVGFNDELYLEAHPEIDGRMAPFVHFLRSKAPVGPWSPSLITGRKTGSDGAGPPLRIALHCHVHDGRMAEDLISRIAKNKCSVDLLVSAGRSEEAEVFRTSCRNAIARSGLTANIGEITSVELPKGELLPFLPGLAHASASGYDLFGFVQLKRTLDMSSAFGESWRRFAWEHLLGGREPIIDGVAAAFSDNEGLGLVFPAYPRLLGWGQSRAVAESLKRRLGLNVALTRGVEFPVGFHFWARPGAISALSGLAEVYSDYVQDSVPFVEAVEHLLPFVSSAAGFEIQQTQIDGTAW